MKLKMVLNSIKVRDVTFTRVCFAFTAATMAVVPACSSDETTPTTTGATVFGTNDPFDVPAAGLTADERATFITGDGLFDLPLREYDGLGPLYTRTSCGDCHKDGVRGPGLVQKMVVVGADGVTPAADQSALPFGHTVHPLLAAGAKTPIVPPPDNPAVKVTTRVGPPILGRGYIEAVDDAEIERMAAQEALRTDGVHGRVNHVVYQSQANPDTTFHNHQPGDIVIGRFGLKARVATLDDFTADALQGDMGITSPLRPQEIPNPDGLTDDLKPGVDLTIESVNNRAMYVRMTAIPRREPGFGAGQTLFASTGCDACHVPTLKTRADYPLKPMAGIDAAIYSDLLLHDLGDALADGMVEGEASPRDWRTAPLIGLRFNHEFMHDGRATTIVNAVRAHAGPGSEATTSVNAFNALSPQDQQALLDFVGSL